MMMMDEKNMEGLSEHLLDPRHNESNRSDYDNNQYNIDYNENNDEEAAAPLAGLANDAPVDPVAAGAVQSGETQPRRFRDAWAALLFLLKQLFVLYMAFGWGWPHLNDSIDDADYDSSNNNNHNNNNNNNTNENGDHLDMTKTLRLVFLVGSAAMGLGMVLLTAMTKWAERFVQASLYLSAAVNILLAVFFLLQGNVAGLLVCVVLTAYTVWYARTIHRRIPLAAAHLRTSLTAVQTNASVLLVALCMTFAMCLWCMVWSMAVWGVYVRTATCTTGTDDQQSAPALHCQGHMPGFATALLILSLIWTFQVSQNIVHVTVSGTVGTWWFCPEDANGFWSTAVQDSWWRASTYSLGSICLGSLLTALMHTLHTLARWARRHTRNDSRGGATSMLLCVVECLLRCTERLLTYFNKWAYVYVGLYGYDYLTAGQKVMRLFQERGWTTIIQDDLILRCLDLATLALGAATGALCVTLCVAHPSWIALLDADGQINMTAFSSAFAVAFLIGIFMGKLLFGVVASAVNTVMVTWAEAPVELERHYPGLYAAQVAAWRQAYPQDFGM